MADKPKAPNEKPIKLPDDFEQTLKDLLATGPTPKDEKDAGKPDK